MRKKTVLLLCLALCLSPVSAEGGKVALVLSGGGARGYAEIAVIERMEKYGIPIDMVIGTSMGALFGSLYSCGYTPKQITEAIESRDLMSILLQPVSEDPFYLPDAFSRRNDIVASIGFSSTGVGSSPGLLGDQKLLSLLSELYGRAGGITNFDQLPVPFRAVATDAITGARIVYDHGSLITAVRSSISLPLVFVPYPQENGSLAVDGGMSDNIPILLARDLGADFVVAVDVNADQQLTVDQLNTLSDAASQALFIATQASSIRQYDQADILLCPKIGTFGTLAFDQFKEIYQGGKDQCDLQNSEFVALAARVSDAGRELKPLDPDRESAFKSLPLRTIATVKVNNYSTNGGDTDVREEDFDDFVGKVMDDATRNRLERYLERMKISHQLASLSYEVKNNDDDKTLSLEINCKNFKASQFRFTIGGNTSLGLSNNTPSASAWFLLDAKETLRLEHLTKKQMAFTFWLSQGNAYALGFDFMIPIYRVQSHAVEFHMGGDYGFGSYVLDSNPVYGDRAASMDSDGALNLAFSYQYGNFVNLAMKWNIEFLYAKSWDKLLLMPSAQFNLVVDTMHQKTFCQNGLRVHSSLTLGSVGTEQFTYAFRTRYRQDFVLVDKDQMLGYDMQLSWMRLRDGMTSSYVDLGGLEGIPGYSLGTYKKDAITLAVRWRKKICEFLGKPMFLEERLSLGVMNPEDPFKGSNASGSYFSSAKFDGGIMTAIGFDTAFGMFGIGYGFSFSGSLALVIGVFE